MRNNNFNAIFLHSSLFKIKSLLRLIQQYYLNNNIELVSCEFNRLLKIKANSVDMCGFLPMRMGPIVKTVKVGKFLFGLSPRKCY